MGIVGGQGAPASGQKARPRITDSPLLALSCLCHIVPSFGAHSSLFCCPLRILVGYQQENKGVVPHHCSSFRHSSLLFYQRPSRAGPVSTVGSGADAVLASVGSPGSGAGEETKQRMKKWSVIPDCHVTGTGKVRVPGDEVQGGPQGVTFELRAEW